eukprot:10195768-Alexandrium_andersonii.AAC.1
MREGGHVLRFAMRVIEELGHTKFSYIDWPNEGVMIGPDWAMAVMPADEAGKRKALCFNEKLFDLARVERIAMDMWP